MRHDHRKRDRLRPGTGANQVFNRPAAVTRSLLGYGPLAGACYLASGLAQALTRDGFDLRRHDLSLLANGPLGWIHILTLMLTGLMTVASAIGVFRALPGAASPRGRRACWRRTAWRSWRPASSSPTP